MTAGEDGDEQLLKHLALAERLRGRFDLIVFPESALMSDPETDPILRAEIVRIARTTGALVVCDGAQGAPHFDSAVDALGVDVYAFSGHKMLGPMGIGGLVVRREILEAMPPYQFGGDMIAMVADDRSTWNVLPHKFEAGTPNVEGPVGLGAACDYLTALGMPRVIAHERALVSLAMERLAAVRGVTVLGPASGARSGVVSFTLDGVPLGDMSYGPTNGLHISRAVISENLASTTVAQGAGALGTASTSNLGGTIEFVSRKPSDTFDLVGSGTYGSNNTWRGFARLDTGDLGGGLKGYISYGYLTTDKWKGFGSQRQHQVNAKLMEDLGSRGSITAFVDYSDRGENDYQDLSLDIIRRRGLNNDNISDNYPLALQIARVYQNQATLAAYQAANNGSSVGYVAPWTGAGFTLPSGFGTDLAVRPTATVSMHDAKEGMTPGNSGKIHVADIGIPAGSSIVLTKVSGSHGVRSRLADLGVHPTDEEFARLDAAGR